MSSLLSGDPLVDSVDLYVVSAISQGTTEGLTEQLDRLLEPATDPMEPILRVEEGECQTIYLYVKEDEQLELLGDLGWRIYAFALAPEYGVFTNWLWSFESPLDQGPGKYYAYGDTRAIISIWDARLSERMKEP